MAKSKAALTRRRVFLIFQGGGAKGIAHVGALGALQRSPVKFSGFAGTSAGAIVAALASVGFKAEEMFDCDSGRTVLAHIDRRPASRRGSGPPEPAEGPKDLFGRPAWLSLMLARFLARNCKSILTIYGMLFAVSLFASHFLALAWVGFGAVALLFLGLSILVLRGFASLDGLADGIQQLLAHKLSLDPKVPITFDMLKQKKCSPLRIVATNVSTRSAEVFSAEVSPHVSVAEAVAASACIPFVFTPRQIAEHSYYDGGIVSNLPAWVFDEERSLDRDASTVTLEITDASASAPRAVRGIAALSSALLTAFFGKTTLDKRAVGNLYTIGLNPSVGLLDFDMKADQAAAEVTKAREACEVDLINRLIELPTIMGEICRNIASVTLQMINAVRALEDLRPLRGKPRVAIAIAPEGTSRSLRLAFSSGFLDDPDHGLTLPIESSFIGKAWEENRSFYADSRAADWGSLLSRPEDQSLRRLISKDMIWSVTIPFAPDFAPDKRIVVALDGKKAIGVSQSLRDTELLVALRQKISNMLESLVPQELYDSVI